MTHRLAGNEGISSTQLLQHRVLVVGVREPREVVEVHGLVYRHGAMKGLLGGRLARAGTTGDRLARAVHWG
jgi:hypothetical protein